MSGFSLVMATSGGALMLALAVPNAGPVLRAARADGVQGTFTAERVRCVRHPGHEACSWYGAFRPYEETRARTGIYLYGSYRSMLRPGQQVPAVDTGRAARVYAPSGSNEWILTAALLLVGVALFVPLGRAGVRLAGRGEAKERDDLSGTPV